MNKEWTKYLALSVIALSISSCGDDSGTSTEPQISEKTSVETIYDLGKCDDKREGEIVFVEEKDANYKCKDKDWENIGTPESSSSTKKSSSSQKKSSSSSKKESSSSQKISSSSSKGKSDKSSSSENKSSGKDSEEKSSSSKATSSSSVIASSSSNKPSSSSNTPKSSSSSNPSSSNSTAKSSSSVTLNSSSSSVNAGDIIQTVAIDKQVFKGVAEKGPYSVGSVVKLYELDKNLDSTETSFQWKVTGKLGQFTSPEISLSNQYALLQVNGNFFSEYADRDLVWNITLKEIVDLKNRQNVNINVLGHLAHKRVINLFTKSGQYKNVSAAKAAAEQELMKAFNFGSVSHSFEDLSIFGNTEDDAKLLAAAIIITTPSTESTLRKLLNSVTADFAEDGKLDNTEDIVDMADMIPSDSKIKEMRRNLEHLQKPVPPFEKYLSSFLGHAYGFGNCTDSKDGEFFKVTIESSYNLNKQYVCEEGIWRLMNSTERSHAKPCTAKKSGSLMENNITGAAYICDGGNGNWRPASVYESPKEYYFNNEIKYGTLKDTRDGHEYKTVLIGLQTWMAENLNYDNQDNENLFERTFCYGDDKTCNIGGRLYTWSAAMNIHPNYRMVSASAKISNPHQGVCPPEWHIPTYAEWKQLADFVTRVTGASGALKSAKGWGTESRIAISESTDPYGFSAIPTGSYLGAYAVSSGEHSRMSFDDEHFFANFWTATEANKDRAVSAVLDYRKEFMGFNIDDYNQKERGYSVRCLKDYNGLE